MNKVCIIDNKLFDYDEARLEYQPSPDLNKYFYIGEGYIYEGFGSLAKPPEELWDIPWRFYVRKPFEIFTVKEKVCGTKEYIEQYDDLGDDIAFKKLSSKITPYIHKNGLCTVSVDKFKEFGISSENWQDFYTLTITYKATVTVMNPPLPSGIDISSDLIAKEKIKSHFHDALLQYLTLLDIDPGTYNFIVRIESKDSHNVVTNVPYLQELGRRKNGD